MDAEWVDRLEKRLGFLAAPGLPTFIVGMTAAVGILREFKPEFSDMLALDPIGLSRGQAWRVLTFLFVPPPAGALWLVLWIAMLYSILQALESAWGEFKFTFFLAVGVIATGLGAIATGMEFGNSLIMLSTFLAFARLLPEREVLVMFVLPVKLRWLALLSVLWTALDFVTSPMSGRVQILTGLLPYVLFFGAGHARDASMAWRRWRNNP